VHNRRSTTRGAERTKDFIAAIEKNPMIEGIIGSKIVDLLSYQILGKKRIEKIKRIVGIDEFSRIGRETLDIFGFLH
jgi:hypothetical protein